MSKSKKDILNEMKQMAYLMGYDRSKTIFEQANKKSNLLNEEAIGGEKQINEIVPLIVGAVVISELTGVSSWIRGWWSDKGDMGAGDKYKVAVNRSTFEDIEKAMTELGFKVGHDVWEGVDVMSRTEANDFANELYESMDGIGTDEDVMSEVLNNVGSILDFTRISYEYGKKEGETLEEWIDGDFSDADINKLIIRRLAKKPFIVYNKKQYDNGADFIADVEADNTAEKNPKEDQEDFNTVFNALKGKGFDCVTEYLEGMEVGHTPKGVPYIMYVDGDTKLNLFANGRFSEPSTGEMGKIQPCVDAVKESIIRSISEQFIVKMDGSDEVRVIKDVKVDTTVDSDDTEGGVEPETTTKKKSSSSWRKEPNTEPTEGDESTVISKGHYNKNNDSNVKKIQKVLGIKEDGLFGPGTKKSVSAYQKENGLTVDGTVGYETWVKMTSGGAESEGTEKEEEAGGETINPKKEEEIVKKVEGMDPKEVLDSLKTMSVPNKDECVMIVAAARDALPMKDVNATKILQACFKKYNFKLKTRKGVKKAYGIKSNGELRK